MFTIFAGNESTAAAVARYMKRHGLTPDDVLAAYDEWLAARMAEMEPGSPRPLRGHPPLRGGLEPARKSPLPRGGRREAPGGARHKAGDLAQLPDACPRCMGTVEMLQLCHISSPVWRTQLACMTDGCAWHGKSRLPIDALLARGAGALKDNATEG